MPVSARESVNPFLIEKKLRHAQFVPPFIFLTAPYDVLTLR
jgi:hypothetical protein